MTDGKMVEQCECCSTWPYSADGRRALLEQLRVKALHSWDQIVAYEVADRVFDGGVDQPHSGNAEALNKGDVFLQVFFDVWTYRGYCKGFAVVQWDSVPQELDVTYSDFLESNSGFQDVPVLEDDVDLIEDPQGMDLRGEPFGVRVWLHLTEMADDPLVFGDVSIALFGKCLFVDTDWELDPIWRDALFAEGVVDSESRVIQCTPELMKRLSQQDHHKRRGRPWPPKSQKVVGSVVIQFPPQSGLVGCRPLVKENIKFLQVEGPTDDLGPWEREWVKLITQEVHSLHTGHEGGIR